MAEEKKRVILVAVDNSDFAEKAFDYYTTDIKKDGDILYLVHIPECYDLSLASPAVVDKLLRELKESVEAIEKKYKMKMQEKHLGGKFRTDQGKPGEKICKIAHEVDAAMIIVGTRGLGKFRRTFLGSVSSYIVHHSHVPVVICRHR